MAPVIPFIPLIAAGVGAAATGIAIAEMPSAPKTPDTATDQAKAQQNAAQAQAAALQRRRGMAATTLTSPMGAQSATTGKATLGA